MAGDRDPPSLKLWRTGLEIGVGWQPFEWRIGFEVGENCITFGTSAGKPVSVVAVDGNWRAASGAEFANAQSRRSCDRRIACSTPG
jgi:hypothetical protein